MITVNTARWVRDGANGTSAYYCEGECLSTDTKPLGKWANGSKLIEMDTSKIYFYDEQNNTWREFT